MNPVDVLRKVEKGKLKLSRTDLTKEVWLALQTDKSVTNLDLSGSILLSMCDRNNNKFSPVRTAIPLPRP